MHIQTQTKEKAPNTNTCRGTGMKTGTKKDAMRFWAVELEPPKFYLTFNILDSLTFYEKLNIRYKNKSVVEKPFYSNEKV